MAPTVTATATAPASTDMELKEEDKTTALSSMSIITNCNSTDVKHDKLSADELLAQIWQGALRSAGSIRFNAFVRGAFAVQVENVWSIELRDLFKSLDQLSSRTGCHIDVYLRIKPVVCLDFWTVQDVARVCATNSVEQEKMQRRKWCDKQSDIHALCLWCLVERICDACPIKLVRCDVVVTPMDSSNQTLKLSFHAQGDDRFDLGVAMCTLTSIQCGSVDVFGAIVLDSEMDGMLVLKCSLAARLCLIL